MMSLKNSEISCAIIIPTKDRPNLLMRSVSSALAALPTDGELIVVDDKSKPPAADALAGIDDTRLRIVVNGGHSGASAARNVGIAQASAEVIFFLDDDDEMQPDYCRHVLTKVIPENTEVSYGGSSCIQSGAEGQEEYVINNYFSEGIIPAEANFRRRLFGFGMGFWILNHTLEEMGPIDDELATNEDTEYVCRLVNAGKLAWFSSKPGVRLQPVSDALYGRQLTHLTHRTPAFDRATAFQVIYIRYLSLMQSDPSAGQHISRRYLKNLAKSGAFWPGLRFIATLPSLSKRVKQRAYLLINWLIYRFKR